MSISQKKPLILNDTDIPTLNRMFSKSYDDLNDIINAVNNKITVDETNRYEGQLGDIKVVQNSNKTYELQGRTKDGWAFVELDFKDRQDSGGLSTIVESLAETKTLGIADSGKVFICSQAAAYDITIPVVTTKGWTAKFILGTAGANDFDVIGGTADKMVGLEMGDTNTAITANSDQVTFDASNAVVGDWIEVLCDGSNYYVTHAAVADAGAEHSG